MLNKSLKKFGAACLAAAMVFTSVNVPVTVKAEDGTAVQADEETASELEKGKVLVQVNPTVLRKNAMTNSIDQSSSSTLNGPWYAFDGKSSTVWVSRWSNNNQSAWMSGNFNPAKTVTPWISSGADREMNLKKIVYYSRGGTDCIKDYKLYTSDDNSNWTERKTGTFQKTNAGQEINLDEAVTARYFKLEAVSNYKNNTDKWADCSELKVYEEKDISLTLTPSEKDNFGVTCSTDGENSEQVMNGVGEGTSVNSGSVVAENTFDLHDRIAVTTGAVGDFSSSSAKYIMQLKLNLKDFRSGTAVRVITKGNEGSLLVRASGTNVNVSIGSTSATDTNENTRYLEASVSIPFSEISDQTILITAVRSGTSVKIWAGNRSSNLISKTSFDFGTVANTIYIGNPASDPVMGEISDVKIINCNNVSDDITTNRPDIDTIIEHGGQYVLDLKGTPAVDTGYSVETETTSVETTDPETQQDKNTYTTTMTLTPTDGNKILTAPQAVTVNIDGNADHNKLVPVSETGTLSEDGSSATVKYIFEDMFRGGSLRMVKGESGTVESDMTDMRFGYDFQVDDDAEFTDCEWYYGTAVNNLKSTLAPGTGTRYIQNPTAAKKGYIRSNIVFTNLGTNYFTRNVYSRVLVKYTKDGQIYSKMGAYIDTKTVKNIADAITGSENASQAEKDYVNKLFPATDEN